MNKEQAVNKIINSYIINPINKSNHVGVEIEFVSKISHKELASRIYDTYPEIAEFIVLKRDGSIECENENTCESCDGSGVIYETCEYCNGYGCEVCNEIGSCRITCPICHGSGYTDNNHEWDCEAVICSPESMINTIIKKLLDVIKKEANGYVNSSCGLHVHLDMRSRNISKCYRRLFNNKKYLFKLLPDSRLFNNRYCQPNENKNYLQEKKRNDRYLHFNPISYEKHKTLEIRMHTGSLNYTKIKNWIELLLKIVDNGSTTKEPLNYKEFKKRTKISRKLEAYMKGRAKEFNKELTI
jgi:hypothetical protein